MKKIKLLSILGMIILLFTGCLSEEDRAEKVLEKHLKERYGEEFVIYGMGKRAGNVRRWYEAAVVYPKSYIGTRKENDSYYWGKGFIELNNGMKGGDTYGKVLLNESANEFYGKKLKELFGENYLAVIDVKGPYSNRDFEKEMESRRISLEKELGGIYIFGRVENDKDREWYRKQIYEFIQFMKETGTFEYVDLSFYILDERILTKQFEEIAPLLIKKIGECKNSKEFIEYRSEILAKLNHEAEKITSKDKKDKIDNYSKSAIREFNNDSYTGYCTLYHTVVRSVKFLEVETRLSMYKKLEYNSKKNIQLLNTIQIIFKEYEREKLYNNEWGD